MSSCVCLKPYCALATLAGGALKKKKETWENGQPTDGPFCEGIDIKMSCEVSGLCVVGHLLSLGSKERDAMWPPPPA